MVSDQRSRPPFPERPPQQPATSNPLAHPINQAQVVEEVFAASIMASIGKGDLGSAVQAAGYKHYRDRLIRASGNPTDPIEIMLIEQLAWAQLRLGGLSAKAAAATSPELVEAYNVAAARLMTEFRRSALALRGLRSPAVPQQLVVVKQQNVAAGNQQIALVEGAGPQAAAGENPYDTELVSTSGLLTHVEPTPPIGAANCWETQPVEARVSDASRPAAAPRRRASRSAMDQVNGSQNRRR